MELTIKDRIALLDILPSQGDYASLKLVRQLREELSLEDVAEAIGLQISQVDGQTLYAWNLESAEQTKAKNVPLVDQPAAQRLIQARLRDLDQRKQLTMDHLPLFERFIQD